MDENRDKRLRERVARTTGWHQAWREALLMFLLLVAAIVGLVALATAPTAPRSSEVGSTNGPGREAIGRDAAIVGMCALAVILFEIGRTLLATL